MDYVSGFGLGLEHTDTDKRVPGFQKLRTVANKKHRIAEQYIKPHPIAHKTKLYNLKR